MTTILYVSSKEKKHVLAKNLAKYKWNIMFIRSKYQKNIYKFFFIMV